MFPTTHSTWLVTRIEDDFPAARAHILERYFEPLCAYVRSSQLRAFGEPADLVNDFLTHRVTDPAYLARWGSSGLPLRRWLANGLLMQTRNAALAARRRRELFANGGASQSERPTGKVRHVQSTQPNSRLPISQRVRRTRSRCTKPTPSSRSNARGRFAR